MKTVCRFVLLTLFFTGCSKPVDPAQPVDVSGLVERDSLSFLADRDGTPQEPFTGEAVSYYNSGEVEQKITFKAGKLHGPHETFYKSGQVKIRSTYNGGEKEGLVEEHYETGQLKEKTQYQRGRLHGPFETYYENGATKRKGAYKHGKRHGALEWYSPDAELLDSTVYKNGEAAVQDSPAAENVRIQDETGPDSLTRDAESSPEAPSPDQNPFNDTTAVDTPTDAIEEKETENGKFLETYYENGQLKGQRMMRNGRNHGPYRTYFENGQAEVEAAFKDGKPHGPYKKYDQTGRLIEQGRFKEGRRVEQETLTDTP